MTGRNALGATSDGRAIFEFGRWEDATFWSFAPDTDAWEQIQPPGVRPERVWITGDTLVVLTTRSTGTMASSSTTTRCATEAGRSAVRVPR